MHIIRDIRQCKRFHCECEICFGSTNAIPFYFAFFSSRFIHVSIPYTSRAAARSNPFEKFNANKIYNLCALTVSVCIGCRAIGWRAMIHVLLVLPHFFRVWAQSNWNWHFCSIPLQKLRQIELMSMPEYGMATTTTASRNAQTEKRKKNIRRIHSWQWQWDMLTNNETIFFALLFVIIADKSPPATFNANQNEDRDIQIRKE